MAAEHDKTDVVTVDDGSTYVGEIKSVGFAAVKLNTHAAGLVTIEWRHVKSLTSRYLYRVELSGGERRFGSLGPGSRDRRLAIIGSASTTEVDFVDVFEIVPIERTFWGRLDGQIGFGLSYTQTNEFLQYNLGGDVSYRSRRTLGALSGQSLLNTQNDAPTSSQHNLKLTLVQVLKGRWGTFELGQVQSNPDLGYDGRLVLGGGATAFLVESSRTVFNVIAGAVYNGEIVTESSEVDQSAEAVLGFGFRRFKRDSHSPAVQVGLLTFTGLSGESRFRLVLTSSLTWKVVGDVSVSLQVSESYDTDPPGAGTRKNDLTLVTSVGYTF